MNKLKIFSTETQYDLAKDDFEWATVSLLKDVDEIRYMQKINYAERYLTFKALEDGTFTFTMDAKLGTQCISSISYSLDDGETWTTTNNVDNESVTVTTPTVTSGNKVLWKASAVQFCTNTDSYPGGNMGSGSFSSSGNYNVSGNIMSLLYGDNFSNQTTLPTPITSGYGAGTFGYLFRQSNTNTKLVSAENLILPATTLTTYCYYYMFQNCTGLTTAPELPATTLANSCYMGMFNGCTSLTTAPALNATTLENNCYSSMFNGCTSLTTAPALNATILSRACYSNMFNGCTSLTTAPVLPATTLADYCYGFMFDGCTGLTTAPELPVTTLTLYCYQYMFRNCNGLTTAPALNATTLTYGCYQGMFQNCTSLTTAPELPATTLVDNCYSSMFSYCTRLNYIKAMFTTTPSSSYTSNWVSYVAATGTFVKNSAAQWNVTGSDGIPNNWTVETASA